MVDAEDKNMGTVPVRAWVTLDVAKTLLSEAGQDFDALKSAAVRAEFRPVALDAKADFELQCEVRAFKSRNVLARLDGGDLKDEWIVYSAHWDHLGQAPGEDGEPPKIFRGALDNASGVGVVLGMAKAFLTLPEPARRSVLFMAFTAEESGLLGAKYYATHPLYPLDKTLADFNVDGVNAWGPTRDIENVTTGHSDLDILLAAAAAAQGRVVVPDTQPEKGMAYRADHFEFFKYGVPALYLAAGKEVTGRPEGFGRQKADEYVSKHYHQPSDRIDPSWDLAGAVEDARLLFAVGYEVANGEAFPQWNPGGEFSRDSAPLE